jgi:hypothetical protein
MVAYRRSSRGVLLVPLALAVATRAGAQGKEGATRICLAPATVEAAHARAAAGTLLGNVRAGHLLDAPTMQSGRPTAMIGVEACAGAHL